MMRGRTFTYRPVRRKRQPIGPNPCCHVVDDAFPIRPMRQDIDWRVDIDREPRELERLISLQLSRQFLEVTVKVHLLAHERLDERVLNGNRPTVADTRRQ